MRLAGVFLLAAALLAQSESVLEQADAAFRAGDLARAETLARRAVAGDPGAVHAHMILGVIAAQKNQWEVSNRHFQAVVRLEPANPFGYFYLGQAKLYQQQWAAAVAFFTKALERQYPDRERLLIELAMAENEAGHPRQALDHLRQTPVPSDAALAAQYHAVRGFALAKVNQPAAAIEAVRKSLQLDDAQVEAWDFLIGELIQADQAPQALAEAIRAQRRFPDHADTQFLFALASYHVIESPLGRLALRNLREAEPGSPRVLLAEGLLCRKQGKNEEATAAFEKAAQAGVPDAHLLLGIVRKENGDFDGAEREYREAERVNPRNGQAMLELGKLLLNRGRLEEARLQLEKALQYMPDASTVHYQLGLVYRRLGQSEKAQEHSRLSKQ